jgi:hypothetical protein
MEVICSNFDGYDKFYRFLVVANGLVAGYSLIQGLRCAVSMIRGSVLFNKPLAWAIFSGDQVHLDTRI